jgi:hypothetical protein
MTNFSDEKFIIGIRRICHMVLKNIQEIMQRHLEWLCLFFSLAKYFGIFKLKFNWFDQFTLHWIELIEFDSKFNSIQFNLVKLNKIGFIWIWFQTKTKFHHIYTLYVSLSMSFIFNSSKPNYIIFSSYSLTWIWNGTLTYFFDVHVMHIKMI